MDSPERKNPKFKEKKLPTISPEFEPTASTSSAARCNEKTSTNKADTQTNQPNHVIKQIIALDSKDLKGLGIESFILSAISKLNGNKNVKNESNDNVQTTSNTTIKTEILSPKKDRKSNEMPLIQPSTSDKKTTSNKKIQVLSQVVLNEDLRQFSANITKQPALSKTDTLIHPAQIFLPIKSEVENVQNIIVPEPENTSFEIENSELDLDRSESPLDFEGFPPIYEIKIQTGPESVHVDCDDRSLDSDSSELSLDELIKRAKETIEECDNAQDIDSVDSSEDSEDSSDNESIDNNFLDDFLNSTKQKFSIEESESDRESTQSDFQGRSSTNYESEKSLEPVVESNIDEPENIVSLNFDKTKTKTLNSCLFLHYRNTKLMN